MRFGRSLAYLGVILAVPGCGGGGSSGGGGDPVVVVPPAPTPPTPPPTPAPPTPTPPPPAPTVTLSYLHAFQAAGDGSQPTGPLLQANDGNFYGTTRAGGAAGCTVGCGTIFRITAGGAKSVLHRFGTIASDGLVPSGPLIQGADGALYGVATTGGAFGRGAVFRITLAGSYSVLYAFGAASTDGATPTGALVQATDGNFYGTTASGGTNQCSNIPQAGANCGTIFRLTPSGTHTLLYAFGASRADGVTPNGSLLQASDGNLYGTTLNGGANNCSQSGGTNNCGTVFRISTTGAFTILHSFGSTPSDGVAPQGALIQGSDGAFYGTTASGGGQCSFPGCGTVFRITATGQASILYAFALARTDGRGPTPFLIQARDGNFYGATNSGGVYQSDLTGTIFRLTPTGQKTILYSFGPLNEQPSAPEGGLIQAADGSFYGITAYNGPPGTGLGSIFRMTVQ